MAHDVRDSSSQTIESKSVWEEKCLEPPQPTDRLSVQSDNSRSGPSSDTKSIDPSRNGASGPSTNVSRSAEGSTVEDSYKSQHLKSVRTLPAWIRSVEYPDEGDTGVAERLLPAQPNDALVAQHNHSPHDTSKSNYGHLRGESLDEGDYQLPYCQRESRWKTFSRAIAYPREEGTEEKIVTPEWLNENIGDFSEPWRGRLLDNDDLEDPMKISRRREIWFKRFHSSLLRSPIVPLIFRLTVWCFSLTALALGASIQHLSNAYRHPQGGSALMAIIVDAVALVYLVYITWDEYTAKPLGLRSPSAKARLVLLDIFFIVFDSANLSMAFESLSAVEGSCTTTQINQTLDPKNDAICDRQKALASVLLIALLAWLVTFSISVLRLVERVSH